MKKYYKLAGNLIVYFCSYYFIQFVTGIIIEVILEHIYGSSHNGNFMNDIINRNAPLMAMVGDVLCLWLYLSIFKNERSNLIKRCKFNKIDFKSIIEIIVAAIGIAVLIYCLLLITNSYAIKSYTDLWKKIGSDLQTPMGYINIIIAGPIFEEILYRGIVFNDLKQSVNIALSIILQALIFAGLHWNFIQGICALITGIILAVIYIWTDSIISSMLFHSIYNLYSISGISRFIYYNQKLIPIVIVFSSTIFAISFYCVYENRKRDILKPDLN